MQLKSVFTASAAAVLAFAGWQVSNSTDPVAAVSDQATYAPRTAAQFRNRLKAPGKSRNCCVATLRPEMNEDGLRELRHEVERFAANQSSNNRATDHYWNEMGPDNIGGRVRAIAAIIPEDGSEEQVLYAGSIWWIVEERQRRQ